MIGLIYSCQFGKASLVWDVLALTLKADIGLRSVTFRADGGCKVLIKGVDEYI